MTATLALDLLPGLIETILAEPVPETGTASIVMSAHVTNTRALQDTSALLIKAGLRRLGTGGSFTAPGGTGLVYAAGAAAQWRTAADRWSKPPRKSVPFFALERSSATIRNAGIEPANTFSSDGGQTWAITIHPDPDATVTQAARPAVLEAITSRVVELGGTPSPRDRVRAGTSLTYMPVRLPDMAAVLELSRMDTIRHLAPVAAIGVRAATSVSPELAIKLDETLAGVVESVKFDWKNR
jgi:hypothetical protein